MAQLLATEYFHVPDYENYRVGRDGSVWSRGRNSKHTREVDGWHELLGGLDKDGYRKVILCDHGKHKYMRVNILVLTVFRGPPPISMNNPTAAHNDGNKLNNSIDNLRWATQIDNIADKILHGTSQIGTRHPRHIINEETVRLVRSRRQAGDTLKTIANSLKLKLPHVASICSRNTWKHVS